MKYVKGFTFLILPSDNQSFAGDEAKASLKLMCDNTHCDTAVFAVIALQDHPQSEHIDYTGPHVPTEKELKELIAYAKVLGLRVILKPMVNCRNGVWRAHINFFDLEVPCEPKWSKWFESYNAYLLRYAKIAEETDCEMLMIGCELVNAERKEQYWRALISDIRKIYKGALTYNTDKYQETEVRWWDALDVISSSGYYPIHSWQQNLDRIEAVVRKYQKPFFFAECGAPCRSGCSEVPNDWTYEGLLNLEEQRDYYRKMFEECSGREWVEGFVCWAWESNINDYPIINDGYSVYGKPSCEVIRNFYTKEEGALSTLH